VFTGLHAELRTLIASSRQRRADASLLERELVGKRQADENAGAISAKFEIETFIFLTNVTET